MSRDVRGLKEGLIKHVKRSEWPRWDNMYKQRETKKERSNLLLKELTFQIWNKESGITSVTVSHLHVVYVFICVSTYS